jgi:hypothetical protein
MSVGKLFGVLEFDIIMILTVTAPVLTAAAPSAVSDGCSHQSDDCNLETIPEAKERMFSPRKTGAIFNLGKQNIVVQEWTLTKRIKEASGHSPKAISPQRVGLRQLQCTEDTAFESSNIFKFGLAVCLVPCVRYDHAERRYGSTRVPGRAFLA